MTVEREIPGRIKAIKQDYHKNLEEQDSEYLSYIETIFGRCCNCATRFGCLQYGLAYLGVGKEMLMEMMIAIFDKCEDRTFSIHVPAHLPKQHGDDTDEKKI